MEIEIFFLVLAIFALLIDFAQLSKAKPSTKSVKKRENGSYASALGFGLVLVAYLMLVQGFVTDNFQIQEVFTYSSSGLPAISKIGASWAGAGGSLLFLTLMIGAVYFAHRLICVRDAASRDTSRIMNLLLVFFVVMAAAKNPFAAFSVVPPDGSGLNPQLQTFWMTIHPPIVFASYALILLAFAATLASMKNRTELETKVFRLSTESAWLLLTIGIAIGGLWAYEVLGWGGYWAWDPVETGSLLTWLALTAYFHAGQSSAKSMVKQLTLLVTFVALIFLSALTRGGLLQSVHAYALSPAGPILLSLALGMSLYFLYLKGNLRKPLFFRRAGKPSLDSTALSICFFSLAAIFAVSLFGVAYPIAEQFFTSSPWTPAEDFYNYANFPFAMAFVAASIGCALENRISVKVFAALVVACLALGAALVRVSWPTQNMLANLGLPLAMAALLGTVYGLARTLFGRERQLKLFGRSLIHLGVVVTLIGIFLSAGGKQIVAQEAQIGVNGATALAPDLKISIVQSTGSKSAGNVYYSSLDNVITEYSSIRIDVNIESGETVYREALWAYLYVNYGPVARPLIIHTMEGDLYVHVGITQTVYNALVQALIGGNSQLSSVTVTVEKFPFIYLLWGGVVLLCLGIALALVKELAIQPDKETEPLKAKHLPQ